MRARTVLRALLVAAASTLSWAAGAGAQDVATMNCLPDRVWTLATDTIPEPWAGYHPRVTFRRAQERLATGSGWRGAAAEVRAAFGAMADLARLDTDRRTALLAQLDAMAADLAAHGGATEGLEDQGRFQVTPRRDELAYRFDGTELTVRRDAPVETVRAICWTAVAANELLGLANAPARRATLEELGSIVAAWDAFNETGYAQYPWELFLNRPDGLRPPRTQLILMHPGVALEVPGLFDGLEEATRTESVILEVGGALRYTADRRFYGGASLVLSLPDAESVGAGVLAHMGPLKAGYVWRAEAEGEPDRDGVVVTADLLQLFRGAPDLYQAAREEALALLRRTLAVP